MYFSLWNYKWYKYAKKKCCEKITNPKILAKMPRKLDVNWKGGMNFIRRQSFKISLKFNTFSFTTVCLLSKDN